MAEAAVGADLGEPLDVERDLTAEVALDPALQLLGDDVAQLADLGVAQILGARIGGNTGERQHSLCSGRANPVDVRQGDLDPLVPRDVNAGDTCHYLCVYPCRCLCFGFSQITRTAPWRLMTLQCSHRRLTDALTFILVTSSSWLAA